MEFTRRGLLGTAALAAAVPGSLRAQAAPALKIGVLTDMSGPYKDLAGPVAVQCLNQALEDFGVSGKGMRVEVLTADHQNKPDVGATIARSWCDRDGLDVILEVANSGVGLAVAGVAKEKNKVYINTGAATSDLTGAQCNANTIHWVYDTYMLAKSTGGAMVKNGGDSWYFITADYAFGHALTRDTTGFINAASGKVVGETAYPFPATTDFSSQLLQASSSGAKVIGLSSAGTDTINQIKQAKEFGLTDRGIKLAGPAGVHLRRACAGAGDGAGPRGHQQLLLGCERPYPGVLRAVEAQGAQRAPDDGAGGRVFGGAALPEDRAGDGGRGGEEGRRRHGGAHEGDADGG